MKSSEGTPQITVALGLGLVFALCLLMPTSAFAAASYVFEPTLSLTGNCTVTMLDEVPDPGPCPGTPEVDHPSAGFKSPSVTTDSYGDIYVVNMLEKEARIDVFSPEGVFITEFKDPAGPQSIAVDSEGNMYLFERVSGGERQVRRFPPTVYKPKVEEIEYGKEPVVLTDESTKELISPLGPESSLDVDRSTGRVYLTNGLDVYLFGSVAEENTLLQPTPIIDVQRPGSIAIDAVHKKIYIGDDTPITHKSVVRIFEEESPYKELGKITGSTTPKGEFLSKQASIAVDVDDNAGHLFVGDIPAANKVYEFEEDGTYLATIEHSFEASISTGGIPGEIAVDDGEFSPHLQAEAWLFVPAISSPGHLFAFEPKEECAPEVSAATVGDITATEATLHATINPCGLPTEYRLEFISRQQYEEEGESFVNAAVAGEGTLPKGAEDKAVSATASGLEPDTSYVFRAIAENKEGKGAVDAGFKTFPPEEGPPVCENDPVRAGLSALLPDCRAFELVTPPNTNGHAPIGGFSGSFPTLLASPNGDRASFVVEGGLIPGNEGTGSFDGDLYLSTRSPMGWSTAIAGPNGEEAFKLTPGSVSPDQTYSFWSDASGSHVHHPDGHSEFVGKGSLGEDPEVDANLIAEGATHIVFATKPASAVQLEPNAAPAGTAAVYDRPAAGPTQVVSLLPGDEPQKAGENAAYLGASEDGEGIAFSIAGSIYLRLHNEETFEVAGPGSAFAGVADEGNRVFYLEGGDLFAFDAAAEETIAFSSSGDVTPVNVASGGTRAYFVSPSVLTGEPNPEGEEAEGGKENLYLSEEGTISFVGIVTERDVEGEKFVSGRTDGLGLWMAVITGSGLAKDPSRTTPAGSTFLFESRADLTEFESEGFAQVYRYDSAQNRLDCLSCSPIGTPPTSDASLQSVGASLGAEEPGGGSVKIPNQSPDGQRAFFQTAEKLVLGDTDGKLDVYEWEEKGTGDCKREDGCVYLISGRHSSSPDYLFAMSSSGNDVFFRTADILLPRDLESTLSIYDARVGGGFAEPKPKPPCEGESCHPVGVIPDLPQDTTSVEGPEEVPQKKCPKGKHKVKRHGKTICVKSHHKKKHHHRPGQKKRGGAR